jgi:hypothetical protein
MISELEFCRGRKLFEVLCSTECRVPRAFLNES